MQHWHERYTHDPAVRWLRSLFAELFGEQSRSAMRNANGHAALPADSDDLARPSEKNKSLGGQNPAA